MPWRILCFRGVINTAAYMVYIYKVVCGCPIIENMWYDTSCDMCTYYLIAISQGPYYTFDCLLLSYILILIYYITYSLSHAAWIL